MNKQVNKKELIDRIAKTSSFAKKDVDVLLDAFVNVVSNALVNGEKVSLMGFGSFEVRARAERAGVNPRTGEAITIAATKTPAFKSSQTLKKKVNGEV